MASINEENFARTFPDRKIEYGYKLRDYRKNTDSQLRWSWAVEYKSGDFIFTDYNYSRYRWTAVLAARSALLRGAFKAAKS